MTYPADVTRVLTVAASTDEVWDALTDRRQLANWLGELDSAWSTGEMAKLTLLDGDFFIVAPIDHQPHSQLTYQCAPMGIGIDTTVTWRLQDVSGGCQVRLMDSEPERTPDQARRDASTCGVLLGRLQDYLAGRRPMPACRDGFDAAIELPATVEGVLGLLLEPSMHDRWLAIDEDVEALNIDRRKRQLCFAVHSRGWRRPTLCTLEVRPRSAGAGLAVHQEGFAAIAADPRRRVEARRHWCKVWGRVMRQFALTYVRAREAPAMPAHELHARLGEDGLHVFDTNVAARRREGHIPGSVHLGPDAFTPAALPPDRSATLVFYCLSPT